MNPYLWMPETWPSLFASPPPGDSDEISLHLSLFSSAPSCSFRAGAALCASVPVAVHHQGSAAELAEYRGLGVPGWALACKAWVLPFLQCFTSSVLHPLLWQESQLCVQPVSCLASLSPIWQLPARRGRNLLLRLRGLEVSWRVTVLAWGQICEWVCLRTCYQGVCGTQNLFFFSFYFFCFVLFCS